jgi:hypothetical protein
VGAGLVPGWVVAAGIGLGVAVLPFEPGVVVGSVFVMSYPDKDEKLQPTIMEDINMMIMKA